LSNSTPVIDAVGLTKAFGQFKAVDSLDLTVGGGELFGFLGPNGAGKTTTILVITGFLRPTSGRMSVFGLDSWSDSVAIKRGLGFLPDLSSLYPNLTGDELLSYLGALQGGGVSRRRDELCDALGLARDDLARRIKGYSHGMKRKLAIVQALQHDPDLLVMDEPTQGLDPLIQQSFFAVLREARERGTTIFFSSHVLSEVEELCERVGIIRQGRLVAVERVDDLRTRRRRRAYVRFRGEPPVELAIEGVEIVSRDGRDWELKVGADLGPLLKELARHDLDDLTLERPGLEDIFLEYYSDSSTVDSESDERLREEAPRANEVSGE
jgi:ABC-2 type transport system ATP-binding protein